MSKLPYVQICDPEHPHYPESGYMTGKIITMRFSGASMAEVKLDSCKHGTDACFVSKGQVREIAPPADGSRA